MNPQSNIRFTFVIAARNAEKYIGETLESLARLRDEAFRVIVVNDGSTDATAGIVETFQMANAEIEVQLLNGPARGVSAARNLGLSQVRSDIVVFLDADDLMAEDALPRFEEALDDGQCIAALGRVLRIAEDGAPLPSPDNRDLVPQDDQLYGLIKKNFIVNGGALAIRTSVAKKVGGYDETLKYGEDWEFWCRLLSQGRLATVAGDHILAYRQIATGANHVAASKPFARDIACLDVIAANKVIRGKLGWRLTLALRMRRIDIFWSGVRTKYQYESKRSALLLSALGLLVYPDSLARPKLALRLLKSVKR